MHWNIGSNNLLNISLSHQLNISASMKPLNLSLFSHLKGIRHLTCSNWTFSHKDKTFLSFLFPCLKTKALSIKLREERGVEVFNFPDSEKNCTICPCVVMLRTRGLGLCEDCVGAHFCRIGYHYSFHWPLSVWEVLSVSTASNQRHICPSPGYTRATNIAFLMLIHPRGMMTPSQHPCLKQSLFLLGNTAAFGCWVSFTEVHP